MVAQPHGNKPDWDKLAIAYQTVVHAASTAAVAGEPEAQLTTPVSNLFSALVADAGLGTLKLIRESRTGRTRPDFAALHSVGAKTRQKGFIELKAPGVSVDASTWTGRNATQWQTMSAEAEILIVCNGQQARLYQDGEVVGDDAELPFNSGRAWNGEPLVRLLRRFLDARPTPVGSVLDLSKRLAFRTADLRDRLLWLLDQTNEAGATARGGFEAWKQHVHPESAPRDFADGVSQVVAYGMVLAALSVTGADADRDGYISVAEARNAIRSISPVMAAAFAPLVDKPALFAAVEVELSALETLISAIDVKRVNRSADRRGEPWLYFYEDFLSQYDPEERKQAGVYYTPTAIVQAMVKIVDQLLVDHFGIRLGFADKKVVTLDPATGTGTFPLAVIDRGADRAASERGPAGRAQAANSLSHNLYAFELLPGPYAVAQLRINQRLRDLQSSSILSAHIVLTDTLESPLAPQQTMSLFGDAEVLAAEQSRAKRIKLEQPVTVVIGNPPYRRVEREIVGRGSGGWVVEGKVPGRKGKRQDKSLFDDILDVAKSETNFAHHASLYNLYVYFWRWAIWKAFEAHGEGPGVVAFITGSSWLTGPGFLGLRQLVREVCDEAWVLDLGGDNYGANPEENVFAIETPVSVVILSRRSTKERKQAAIVHYRRVHGTRDEKLAAMQTIADSDNPLGGAWDTAPFDPYAPFVPLTGGTEWMDMPKLADLFPWQQPGCKYGRTWPIATTAETLTLRWEAFVSAPVVSKPALFVTAKTGRNVTTKVPGYAVLNTLTAGAEAQPVIRYAYRSFDRQWTYVDPRLAKTESPSLWSTRSKSQVYFAAPMTARPSEGPILTVSFDVPDLHYYNGRGGKDIIPLYRDKEARFANVTEGLPKHLCKTLGIEQPSPEDIAAYVYALLSSGRYQQRFAEGLKNPGPRVPLTTDPDLWKEAVSLGRELLWLHSALSRFLWNCPDHAAVCANHGLRGRCLSLAHSR
ncbi:MAG: N-6 DNA methylase [Proteobacteria bacterium]|nr:N-6 DNA methylase [Pseudomonadota bacterium]